MFEKRIIKISFFIILIILFTTVNINFHNISKANNNITINIKDFGAHSIDEKNYSKFDSSEAINKAIKFAKNNGSVAIDFGSGRYYAKDIFLTSNVTYYSTQGAELIASPDIKVWHSVLTAYNKTNIVIKGLTVNGNKNFVFGNDQIGSYMVSFYTCNNVTVENCYLYNSWSLGILLQDNCNYVTIKNNEIYDTDCGIITTHGASNNLLIDSNTIYGIKENQMSEPISIYNTNNELAHDITITNNIVHDKLNGSAILVMNATKVLIKGNTAYNCNQGITVGIDKTMIDNKVTISTNITITENIIYNCTGGIIGEFNNSLISKNTIHDLKGVAIWLLSRNRTSLISNDIIIDNKITNINSLGAQEPAIRLENTSSCVVDKNIVSDTRSKVLHYYAIQIKGKYCNNNIVQNNTNLGTTVKNGYQIYVQYAKNNTIQNNITTILDQGTGNKLINNKTK